MAWFTYGGEVAHLAAEEQGGVEGAPLVLDRNEGGAQFRDVTGALVTSLYLWNGSDYTATPASEVGVDDQGVLQRFRVQDVDALFDARGHALLPWERGGGDSGGSTGGGSWDTLTGKPPVIAAGSTQAEARNAINAASNTDLTSLQNTVSELANGGGTGGGSGVEVLTWHVSGPLSTTTEAVVPVYNDHTSARTILAVRTSVGTAPATTSVIVDVNLDGNTIFGTQSGRPTITAGTFTSGKRTGMTVTSWPAGAALAPAIDQVGSSTAPGEDLVVQILVG